LWIKKGTGNRENLKTIVSNGTPELEHQFIEDRKKEVWRQALIVSTIYVYLFLAGVVNSADYDFYI